MNCSRKKFYSLRWKIILCFLFISLIGNNIRIKAEDLKQKFVSQSEREIPIVKTVDVVIIGGTVPAVSAAEKGASVFLIAPRLYLGEDLCATLRLEIDKNRILKTRLKQQIFENELQTTPLKVKAILNKSLIDANVEVLKEIDESESCIKMIIRSNQLGKIPDGEILLPWEQGYLQDQGNFLLNKK